MVDYSCFRGKTFLISGGGGELGGGCALQLAQYGAQVALCDIHQGRLDERVAALKEMGVKDENLFYMLGNLRKPEVVDEFVSGAVSKFGKLDVFINTVGVKRNKALTTCALEDLNYVMEGDVTTYFLLSKAAAPHLIATKGNIVNVSSTAGLRPVWGCLPYSVAKAAVEQMTRCISMELAPKGVRCNNVCPGALKSRFNLRFGDCLKDESQLEPYFDCILRSIPLNRIGLPDDVIPAILFLASPHASFITGASLPVDGSYSNTSHVPEPKKVKK